MNAITYSLINNQSNSEIYYNKIAAFSDKVLTEADNSLFWLTDQYIAHISEFKKEEIRTREEYIFDFLTLGTVWTQYLNPSMSLSKIKSTILIYLYERRRRNDKLKPVIDFIRGILSTLWLINNKPYQNGELLIVKLDKLILWMKSSGEFREEVKRLILIYEYLKTKNEFEINIFISAILKFSNWFETESLNELSDFVKNVDRFLQTKFQKHLLKEDVIFCGRKKIEYLRSMIGAEIMNRAFAKEYRNTEKKALLLPACMKKHPGNKCQAKKVSLDYVCTGCSHDCNINKYREIGFRMEFNVHIIPHSSSFTQWLQKWAVGKNIGVVGVACPLNLITGGLELKSLGIPAQCILLDYCGCKNHWDEKGISTDLNEDKLRKLFEPKEVFCK
jgi:hypothetical protein